jgi:hypothetical protein
VKYALAEKEKLREFPEIKTDLIQNGLSEEEASQIIRKEIGFS